MKFTGERIVEGDTPAWIVQAHMARYRFAARYCGGKAVLDAGCGTGYGSHILCRDGRARRVTGMDGAAEAVEHAQAAYSHPALEFLHGDFLAGGDAWPSRRGTYDVVVAFELLEHVTKPRALLAALRSFLRPGGLLIVSTPNRRLNSPHIPPWEEPHNPFHVREFSPVEFASLVRRDYHIEARFGQVLIPWRHTPRWLRIRMAGRMDRYFSQPRHCELRKIRWPREAHTVTLICRARFA